MALNIVIMAAGKGTRMRSARPKVLHRARPGGSLLQHVLRRRRRPGGDAHDRRHRPRRRRGRSRRSRAPGLAFVRQEPQLGTGHAVQQAAPLLDDDGTTLILNGDVPLIEADTAAARWSPPAAASGWRC